MMEAEGQKVLILMTSGPKTPHRCATPFFIGALMASNDAIVEIFFNMDGTNLIRKGVPESIYAGGESCVAGQKPKSVYEFMKDAKAAGVKLYSCKQAVDSSGLKEEELTTLLDGVVPAGEFAQKSLEADKVLIF